MPTAAMSKDPSVLLTYPLARGVWAASLARGLGADVGSLVIRWAATSLPGAAAALAIINIPTVVAQLLSAYLSGWLADHGRPRALMIAGDAVTATVAVLMGVLLRQHVWLPALVLASVVVALVSAPSQAASMTVVPKLVERQDLPRINAAMSGAVMVRQVAGNVVAGILVGLGLVHAILAAGALALAAVAVAAIFLLCGGMFLIAGIPSVVAFAVAMFAFSVGETLLKQVLAWIGQRFADSARYGSVRGARTLIGGVFVPLSYRAAGLLAVRFGAQVSVLAGAVLLLGSAWPVVELLRALRGTPDGRAPRPRFEPAADFRVATT